MNIEELKKEIGRLQYQVSLIVDTIDHQNYPVEYLILSLGWVEGDIDRVHDIFEKYDNKLEGREKVEWNDFEMELRKELDIGYQTVKSIIIAFHRNDQWSNVCYGYAMSREPSAPIEFFPITRTVK